MRQLIFPAVSLLLRPVHNTYAGREMVLSTSGRITVNASTSRLNPSNAQRYSSAGHRRRPATAASQAATCRPDWRTRLPTARYVRPIVLEYVGCTRRSMPSVRRNVNGSGPAPSASLRDTTRQSQPSRPSGSRKIAWPPTRKQNISLAIMARLIFPVVSFPLRPVRVIRRPFPVFPCPIADCRLSAFARRPAAWNVLHPTWRGREGVLWRMGKAGTVWRRASRCAVSWFP